MALDPSIILAGRTPNPMGAAAQGAQTAQFVNDSRHTNAYRNALREYGPGAFQGDPNAMNQLAAYDPQGMLGMRTTMNAEQRAAEQHQRALAQYTAGLDAAGAQAERDRIVNGLSGAAYFYQRGDEQGYNNWLQQQGLDPAQYPMAQFEAHAMQFAPVLEALESVIGRTNPEVGVRASKILDDGTVVQSTDGGVRVFSPMGEELTGQAAADAIRAANSYGVDLENQTYFNRRGGTLGADIEMGGKAAAAVKAGENAQAAGMEAWEAIPQARASIPKLERVIDLIDEGADVGMIASQLPALNDATRELRNLQNQLGLDIIGSVTFGALSEGELRLALSTALPTNMEGEALKDWARRKMAAQEKLATYMEDQARFLLQPGNTLTGWMDYISTNKQPAAPTAPPPSAPPAAPGGAVSAPTPGVTEDGYMFTGGNPADPQNWKKVD